MTETERRIVKMAILFELRLRLVYGDKESYTREQVTEMIDEMAVEREDETWFCQIGVQKHSDVIQRINGKNCQYGRRIPEKKNPDSNESGFFVRC